MQSWLVTNGVHGAWFVTVCSNRCITGVAWQDKTVGSWVVGCKKNWSMTTTAGPARYLGWSLLGLNMSLIGLHKYMD
jgi:hypothetical protein